MATVLKFPNRSNRARVEAAIRKSLESSHEPETQARKLQEMMGIYDRFAIADRTVEIKGPVGEPFTAAQSVAIAAAIESIVTHYEARLQKAITEIMLQRIAIIDLEIAKD